MGHYNWHACMVSSFIHISTEDLRNTNKLAVPNYKSRGIVSLLCTGWNTVSLVVKEGTSISLIVMLFTDLPTPSFFCLQYK